MNNLTPHLPAEVYPVLPKPFRLLVAASCCFSYIFTGVAGGKNIISYDHGIPWYVHALNSGAGIAYAINMYRGLGRPIKKASSRKALFLCVLAALLGGLSGLNYYTAGYLGSLYMGIRNSSASLIGALCFASRFYICARGTIQCRDAAAKWMRSIKNKDMRDISRMLFSSSLGILISLFYTDAVFAAIQEIGVDWFSANMRTSQSLLASYIATGILAVGGLPFCTFWTNVGLQKITYGFEENGKIIPPDRYTYLSFPFCFGLFSLIALGSASSKKGEMFTQWVGLNTAFILKNIFLLMYGGLSPLLGGEVILKMGREGIKKISEKCCSVFRAQNKPNLARPESTMNLVIQV